MKKRQFMTSMAMAAIFANGMIQTAPAETAAESSEGLRMEIQDVSDAATAGSAEEAKENLERAKEHTRQTKEQLDDAKQKLQEADAAKTAADQAYEAQAKAAETAKSDAGQMLGERQMELEQGLRAGQEAVSGAKEEKDAADQAVLDSQNHLTEMKEDEALAERT